MATIEHQTMPPVAPPVAPLERQKSDSLDPEDWSPEIPPQEPPNTATSNVASAALSVVTGARAPWWGSRFLREGGLMVVAFLAGAVASSPIALEKLGHKQTTVDDLKPVIEATIRAEIKADREERSASDLRESEAHRREHSASDNATAREIEALRREIEGTNQRVEALMRLIESMQRGGRR